MAKAYRNVLEGLSNLVQMLSITRLPLNDGPFFSWYSDQGLAPQRYPPPIDSDHLNNTQRLHFLSRLPDLQDSHILAQKPGFLSPYQLILWAGNLLFSPLKCLAIQL